MKMALILVCWAVTAVSSLYIVAGPSFGIAYHAPLASAGLILVGLGMLHEARHRLLRPAPVHAG